MKKLPKLSEEVYKTIFNLPTLQSQKEYLLNNITDVEYTVKNINDSYALKAAKIRNKIKSCRSSNQLITIVASMLLSSEGMKRI